MIHLIVDTETTGLLKPKKVPLNEQPRIIELCIVRTDGKEVIASNSWLISPEQEITAEITKITGIKNEDLIGKPTFKELLPEIEEAFLGADTFIAHNAPFDRGMLLNDIARAEWPKEFPWPASIVCTVQEFQHEYGRRMKLTELYEKKVGKPLAQTHRALDDVLALHEALIAANFYASLEVA